MSCNCFINDNMCTPNVFGECNCGQNSSTSTTTLTSYSSTSSSTSSTTTLTTTVCASRAFTIINNLSITDLFYQLVNHSGVVVYQNYLLSGQTQNTTFPCCAADFKIHIEQTEDISFSTLVTATQDVTNQYTFNNVTQFDLGYDLLNCDDTTITLGNTSTTTTSSTTLGPTTTSTSTSSTSSSSSSTSTSSTSTSSSSSTTSTSTTVQLAFLVRIVNLGPGALGCNTRTSSVLNNPPNPPIVNNYYTLTGSTLFSGQSQNVFSGNYVTSSDTRIFFENTGFNPLNLSVYFSNNGGGSFTLLGSFNLIAYSGSGAYPSAVGNYTTLASSSALNILDYRTTPS